MTWLFMAMNFSANSWIGLTFSDIGAFLFSSENISHKQSSNCMILPPASLYPLIKSLYDALRSLFLIYNYKD